jgi:lipopolysaccharide export system permease protein
LYGIQIFEMEKKGPPRIVYADSASMEYTDNGATLMLRLRSGENHIADADNPENYFRIRFFSQDLAMKNVNDRLERRSRSYRSDREMPIEMMTEVVEEARKQYAEARERALEKRLNTLVDLQSIVRGDSIVPEDLESKTTMDSVQRRRSLQRVRVQEISALRSTERVYGRMEAELKREAQYTVEIQKKYSTGFACFIFILIGAPLGIMARKGGIGTGILYSLAFFVIYWICLIGGENMADRLIVSPYLAMWASNIIIGTFGIFITIAMVRDRFSGDSKFFRGLRAIGGFFKKFFGFFTRRLG